MAICPHCRVWKHEVFVDDMMQRSQCYYLCCGNTTPDSPARAELASVSSRFDTGIETVTTVPWVGSRNLQTTAEFANAFLHTRQSNTASRTCLLKTLQQLPRHPTSIVS